MDSLEERLRERLAAVFGGNESELARVVDTDQQNINNFIRGEKAKGSARWREIAGALGIPEDEMKRLIDERKGRRLLIRRGRLLAGRPTKPTNKIFVDSTNFLTYISPHALHQVRTTLLRRERCTDPVRKTS